MRLSSMLARPATLFGGVGEEGLVEHRALAHKHGELRAVERAAAGRVEALEPLLARVAVDGALLAPSCLLQLLQLERPRAVGVKAVE